MIHKERCFSRSWGVKRQRRHRRHQHFKSTQPASLPALQFPSERHTPNADWCHILHYFLVSFLLFQFEINLDAGSAVSISYAIIFFTVYDDNIVESLLPIIFLPLVPTVFFSFLFFLRFFQWEYSSAAILYLLLPISAKKQKIVKYFLNSKNFVKCLN